MGGGVYVHIPGPYLEASDEQGSLILPVLHGEPVVHVCTDQKLYRMAKPISIEDPTNQSYYIFVVHCVLLRSLDLTAA
jgi:hypothetical protein